MSKPVDPMTLPPAEDRLRSRQPIPPPRPAYLPTAGSPLTVDQDLYTSIQQAPRKLVDSFILPIRSGRAWKAPAGSIVRISTPEGPQVGMTVLPFYLLISSGTATDTGRRPQYLESAQSP